MDKNCNKYESLFIFSDDKTFMEHVESCDDCLNEYQKMQKVSDLIQEVKDEFLPKKKNKRLAIQIACVLFLFLFGGISIDMLDIRYGILDTIKYGEPLTIEDLGFPTDSYGLIQVD